MNTKRRHRRRRLSRKTRIRIWKNRFQRALISLFCILLVLGVVSIGKQLVNLRQLEEINLYYEDMKQICQELQEIQLQNHQKQIILAQEERNLQTEESQYEQTLAILENPPHYIQAALEKGTLKVEYVSHATNTKTALEKILLRELELGREVNWDFSEKDEQLNEMQRLLEDKTKKGWLDCRVSSKIDLLLYSIQDTKQYLTEVKLEKEANDNWVQQLQWDRNILEGKVQEAITMADALKEKENEIANRIEALQCTNLENLPSRALPYANCSVVELLARLANGEGSICTDEEMQVILGVAMNRIEDSRFENSLIEVIFEDGQYACTYDGNFDRDFGQRSVDNAVAVLEGEVIRPVPKSVVWQSMEKQGETWWRAEYHYFDS